MGATAASGAERILTNVRTTIRDAAGRSIDLANPDHVDALAELVAWSVMDALITRAEEVAARPYADGSRATTDDVERERLSECSRAADRVRVRIEELHRHAVACSSCSTCEANYVFGAVDDLMVVCGDAAAKGHAVLYLNTVLAVFRDL